MSVNKYDSAGFAARLRENFPTLYGSTQWTDDEINENWIQSHPEDIAHLSQEAQDKYLDYDVASGNYAYKNTATQAIMDDSYDPTIIGDLTRVVHGMKQFPSMMLEGTLGIPNSVRQWVKSYDGAVKEGLLKGGSQLGVGSKFIRDEPYRPDYDELDEAGVNYLEKEDVPGLTTAMTGLNMVADGSFHASEYVRGWTNKKADEWIANDSELQAYYAWKEDNPFSWNDMTETGSALRAMKNGMIDMAPSIIMMLSPGWLAKAGGAVAKVGMAGKKAQALSEAGKIGNWAKLDKASTSLYNASNSVGLGLMFALEGGSQYHEAMNYLVDEQGMDAKEAAGLAGISAAMYAPVSTYLEKLQFNSMLRMLGLSKRADKVMLSAIMNTVAGKGGVNALVKTARKSAWKKAGLGLLDISINTFEQGVVEGWQETWGSVIEESMKQGYGADPESAINGMFSAMHDKMAKGGLGGIAKGLAPWASDDEHVRESFFSALFGSMMPGGFSVAGTSRKAYKRYLQGLEAGEGGGFKVEVKGSRVSVFNKKGEFVSVYEAGSEEAAQKSAQDYKQQIQDEAIVHYVETMEDSDNLDDLLDGLDIEIDDDSFDTVEGYAKNLATQIEQGLDFINSNMKAVDDTKLSEIEQLVRDGEAHDDNVGLKALNLIKFSKNMNIFRDAGVPANTINAIEAAAVVAINSMTANALMKRLKAGKKVSKGAMDKALSKVSTTEVLAHVANGTYNSILVPLLLKTAKIEVNPPKKRKKVTKENAEEFNQALDDRMNDQIDSEPNINPDVQTTIKDSLEKKIAGKDFSKINSEELTSENITDYLKHIFLKSGSTKLASTLRTLNKTNIYKVAKSLGIKMTKKEISTNELAALETIARKIMSQTDPVNAAANAVDTQEVDDGGDWRATKESKPKKKATKKKAKAKAAPKKKRKDTTTTKAIEETIETEEALSDDPAVIKKQIAAIKKTLKRNEKIADKPAAKKEIKRLKTLLGSLEVKLSAIEKAQKIKDDLKPAAAFLGIKGKPVVRDKFMFEGIPYSIDIANNHIETYSTKRVVDPNSELHKEIMERYISEQVDASRKADDATSGEAVLSQQESGEAEAQEFVEEGEDDGWGVPSKTPMTKEELAELQQEMGTPGKGNVKGKGAKSKEAGESAAKKAEDKIDDELCW